MNPRRLLFGCLAGCLLVLCPQAAFATNSSVDAYLHGWRASNDIPGVAVAALRGEEVSTWTIGSDGHGDPITSDTPFLVGSIAKTVTSTMVLQLVNEGRVSVDDTAQTHLPWLGHDATIRQLLDHTAGYSPGDGLAVSERYRASVTVTAAAQELDHSGEIGSYDYSSANYLVLGALIEQLTGHPFASELRTRVTEPAGMVDTVIHGCAVLPCVRGRTAQPIGQVPELPPGHRLWWGQARSYDPGPEPSGAPYGYLVSTLDDLAAYARAQLDGKLLPKKLQAAAWSEQAQSGDDQGHGYGYGWRTDTSEGSHRVHHTGATPGYFAHLMLLPEKDRAVIVLANVYSEAQAPSLAAAAADIDRRGQGGAAAPTAGDALLTTLPWLTLAPVGLAVLVYVGVLRRRPITRIATIVLIGASATVAGLLACTPALLGMTWHVLKTWMPDTVPGLVLGIAAWIGIALLLALPRILIRPQRRESELRNTRNHPVAHP